MHSFYKAERVGKVELAEMSTIGGYPDVSANRHSFSLATVWLQSRKYPDLKNLGHKAALVNWQEGGVLQPTFLPRLAVALAVSKTKHPRCFQTWFHTEEREKVLLRCAWAVAALSRVLSRAESFAGWRNAVNLKGKNRPHAGDAMLGVEICWFFQVPVV